MRIARAEGKFEDEGWRVRRDGSRFWASVVITGLPDKNGKLRGFSKLTQDHTERRRAEERAIKAESSLRLLADSMPQIVWTALPSGEVDYFNQRWYELTDSSKEPPAGDASWESFVHPEDLERCRELTAVQNAINGSAGISSGFSGHRNRFRDRARAAAMVPLTRREQEILHLIGECNTEQEIACALGVSVRTIVFIVKTCSESWVSGRPRN